MTEVLFNISLTRTYNALLTEILLRSMPYMSIMGNFVCSPVTEPDRDRVTNVTNFVIVCRRTEHEHIGTTSSKIRLLLSSECCRTAGTVLIYLSCARLNEYLDVACLVIDQLEETTFNNILKGYH